MTLERIWRDAAVSCDINVNRRHLNRTLLLVLQPSSINTARRTTTTPQVSVSNPLACQCHVVMETRALTGVSSAGHYLNYRAEQQCCDVIRHAERKELHFTFYRGAVKFLGPTCFPMYFV